MSDIKKFIVSYLSNKSPIPGDIGLYRYLDSGHVDSFGLMQLILEIEDEFEIELLAEDTQSDEFRYIDGLVSIIRSKL